MDRRDTLLALAALALAPRAAPAQSTGRIARIGLLSIAQDGSQFPERHTLEGLRDLGWVEGKNVALETRYARGDSARLALQAAELAGLGLDVILAFSAGVGAAKNATRSTPVVYGTSQDPVGVGYAASLARPGGNLTGATFLTDELSAKRLELIREIVGAHARVAVLWDPAHVDAEFRGMQSAAPALGVQVRSLEIPRPARADEAVRAMNAAREARAQALVLAPSGFTIANRKRLIELAAQSRIPVVSAWRIFAEEGAVLTYGPDLREITRRIAGHVDRILRGARPEDLPVERPTKFELVINLKAAKAMGLAIPQGVLVRADGLIE